MPHIIGFLLEQFQILLLLGIRRHIVLLTQLLLLGISLSYIPQILHILILQLPQLIPDILYVLVDLPVNVPGIAHHLERLLLRILFALGDRILLNIQISHKNGISLLLFLSIPAGLLLCSRPGAAADLNHLILVLVRSDLHES